MKLCVFILFASMSLFSMASTAVVLLPFNRVWSQHILYNNFLDANFVKIQPGSFLMGSPNEESGRFPDEQQHKVKLTHEFEIQTTPVTQAQWMKIMNSNPSNFSSKEYCPAEYANNSCPNHPVENILWEEVQEFISKLNVVSDAGSYNYRLPTEAEWEYSSRAGTSAPYFFGVDAAILGDYAWFSRNSNDQTQPVGTKKTNPWGLFDMYGNVWQLVQDWYDKGYTSDSQIDPQGPVRGVNKVVRGGSWGNDIRYQRSAARNWIRTVYTPEEPKDRYFVVGFRLVRVRK